MAIDCHCHLSDSRIFAEAPSMIARALRAGVTRIALGGVDPQEWQRQIKLKKQFPDLILTHFGMHPWTVDGIGNADELEQMLEGLSKQISRADGLGETGLDFGKRCNPAHYPFQEKYFIAQIQLAIHHKKPMVLHIVGAHERALEILKTEKASQVPLVLHRYSGSREQMAGFLEIGAYLSFSGEIAATKGHLKVKEAFLAAPLERVLIETDAPDQGKEPAHVNDFYRVGAALRGITAEKLKETVAENFAQIY